MMLSGDEVKARNLISDAIEDHYRAIGYDISVGRVITTDGEERTEFKLKPQGIVEIISREKVKLPHNVAGYAMVKTGLCNEGILPLHIGIVDPGYEGHLSATLLNFGKKEYLFVPGEVFVRLTFHECNTPAGKVKTTGLSLEDYIKERKKKVVNFAETFLNLDLTVKNATEPFLDSLRNRALIWLPLFAAILTGFAFAVTLGVNYSNRNYWTKDDVKAEIKNELGLTKEAELQSQINELKMRIEQLQAGQSKAVPTGQSGAAPAPTR